MIIIQYYTITHKKTTSSHVRSMIPFVLTVAEL